MPTLYGRANATDMVKLLWAVDELGVRCRVVDADSIASSRLHATDWRRDVPVLRDGGFSVVEGNAILRYLCNSRADGTTFYPQAPQARATIDAWLGVLQSELAVPAGVVQRCTAILPPTADSDAAGAVALAQWAEFWAVVEPVLARQRFLASFSLSIADFALGPYLHQWFSLERPEMPGFPHLRRYYDRLLCRPAYRKQVAGLSPITGLRLSPAANRDWFRYDPNANVLPAKIAFTPTSRMRDQWQAGVPSEPDAPAIIALGSMLMEDAITL